MSEFESRPGRTAPGYVDLKKPLPIPVLEASLYQSSEVSATAPFLLACRSLSIPKPTDPFRMTGLPGLLPGCAKAVMGTIRHPMTIAQHSTSHPGARLRGLQIVVWYI